MSDDELDGVAGYMQRAKQQALENVEQVAEGVAADTLSEGKLFEIAQINGISTCVKGKFGYNFVNSDDRLTSPLVRDDTGAFREATWDEAYSRVVDGFETIRDNHGAESLSLIAS